MISVIIIYMSYTKIIETERLILRPFKISDCKECFKNYTSDPMVALYLTWDAHENEQVTYDFLKSKIPLYDNDDYFDWCVTRKEKDGSTTIIGAISCVKYIKKQKYCEIGYCYGTSFWHKGYATEALKAVIDFIFAETEIETIAAEFMATNIKSGNVMKRCHMRKVSIAKEVVYNSYDNIREDLIVKAITKDRYLKFKKK